MTIYPHSDWQGCARLGSKSQELRKFSHVSGYKSYKYRNCLFSDIIHTHNAHNVNSWKTIRRKQEISAELWNSQIGPNMQKQWNHPSIMTTTITNIDENWTYQYTQTPYIIYIQCLLLCDQKKPNLSHQYLLSPWARTIIKFSDSPRGLQMTKSRKPTGKWLSNIIQIR